MNQNGKMMIMTILSVAIMTMQMVKKEMISGNFTSDYI